MPAISEMEYGFSEIGIDAYIEELKSIVIEQAANQLIPDISGIESVCNQEWEGIAKEQFLNNLRTTTSHVSEQLISLHGILIAEIDQVRAAMSNRDENLFRE